MGAGWDGLEGQVSCSARLGIGEPCWDQFGDCCGRALKRIGGKLFRGPDVLVVVHHGQDNLVYFDHIFYIIVGVGNTTLQ